MAEADQPKAKRRVQLDMSPEFCRYVEGIVKPWLHFRGEHDQDRIETVYHDTLIDLREHDKLSQEDANRTYVKTIARRMLYKLWKEEGGYIPIADMPVEFQDAQHIHRHPLRPSEQEVDLVLREERERLSEEDATTFKLRAEGKDYGYISKESGISEDAARQRGSRLKRRLGASTPKQRGKGKNQRT